MTEDQGKQDAELDLDQIVVQACRARGIDPKGARLIRHFANAVYLVSNVVVRVGYGREAVAKARTGVSVALWLCRNGFPATPPVGDDLRGAEPTVIDGSGGQQFAVTFWEYVPQPLPPAKPDFREFGRLAWQLHQMPWSDGPALPAHAPLASVERRLSDPASLAVLGHRSHAWLSQRVEELKDLMAALDAPLGTGPVHGDLYAGNLLRSRRSNWLLGDWDGVCVGARELDLVPTAVGPRFGLPAEEVNAFLGGYGYDVREWRGYSTLREARELSTLPALIHHALHVPASKSELEIRLDSLRSGDTLARWSRQ